MIAPHAVRDLEDIQALVKAGFADLTEAVYLLATIRDAQAARAWLGATKPTSIADMKTRLTRAVQVAVSSAGLAALDLDRAVIGGFSAEFVAGMSGDPARSRRLGDIGANAPALWDWGGARGDPHVLVMLFAAPGGLSALRAEIETADFAAGFQVQALPTADMGGREPFGFVDGVSQPVIDWKGERTPGTNADLDYGNLLTAGEFVLGYPNEYGLLTPRPLLAASADPGNLLPQAEEDPDLRDLGKNGCYLVFRQLSQDVRGFWRWLGGEVEAKGAQGETPEALAQRLVGRSLDGSALEEQADWPIRGVGPAAQDVLRNLFDYEKDADGLICPFSAHVRRANPRTGDMPGGIGNALTRLLRRLGLTPDDRRAGSIASSRFHRVLRRGREYGRALSPAQAADPDAPDPESGLNFIALAGAITRQFEFVQGAWLMNPKFGDIASEQDPLLGNREPFPPGCLVNGFTLPEADGVARKLEALPQFVTVKGGAYFFLPGLRALKYIASR